MHTPPEGSTIYKGKHNGLAIIIDRVLVRRHYWNNVVDEYIRIAAELPKLPRSLTIYPMGRIRRIARLIGLKQAYHDTIQKDCLVTVFSSNQSERRGEQFFLTTRRLRILVEFEEKLSGVYIYDGKIYLIKRRKDSSQLNPHALYDDLIGLATILNETH
jgi:hypothetical protein